MSLPLHGGEGVWKFPFLSVFHIYVEKGSSKTKPKHILYKINSVQKLKKFPFIMKNFTCLFIKLLVGYGTVKYIGIII